MSFLGVATTLGTYCSQGTPDGYGNCVDTNGNYLGVATNPPTGTIGPNPAGTTGVSSVGTPNVGSPGSILSGLGSLFSGIGVGISTGLVAANTSTVQYPYITSTGVNTSVNPLGSILSSPIILIILGVVAYLALRKRG